MNIEVLLQVLGDIDAIYIGILFLGVISGIVIGALPGFTATMGVALFVPFTYSMGTNYAFAFLISLYCSAVYAGSIPAILIRTPGTPAAIATINDGYPMAQKGKAGKALGIAMYASVFGGIFSAIILTLTSKYVADAALKFGPQEYFAIAVLGLSMVIGMAEKSMIKGLISMALGLLLTVIGQDVQTGFPRFTYGNFNLFSGLQILPVMIGIFAISEVLASITKSSKPVCVKQDISGIFSSYKYIVKNFFLVIKCSAIGTFMGSLPGVGAVTASFLGYNEATRCSKNPKEMGTGRPEGIMAPEAANNAVTGGALIPLLSLGIPGDPVTAILLGALMIKGLRPGPELFQTDIDVVYGLFITMILANIVILLVSLIGIRFIARVLEVPNYILNPLVLMFCVVGSYALRNSMFDVYVAIGFGIIGFLMRRYGFPLGSFTLAMILGSLIEYKMLMSLALSKGSFVTFISRPISGTLIAITVIFLVYSLRRKKIKGA